MTPTADTNAPSYTSTVRFTKTADDVFDALSKVTGIAGSWSPAHGSAEAGGELRLDHNHPDPLVLKVDIADRPRSVEWTVLDYPLNPEWVGTGIAFALRPIDSGGTEVEFHHHGLIPQLDCYDQCSRGWDYYLPSLHAYVEPGPVTPLSSAPQARSHCPRSSATDPSRPPDCRDRRVLGSRPGCWALLRQPMDRGSCGPLRPAKSVGRQVRVYVATPPDRDMPRHSQRPYPRRRRHRRYTTSAASARDSAQVGAGRRHQDRRRKLTSRPADNSRCVTGLGQCREPPDLTGAARAPLRRPQLTSRRNLNFAAPHSPWAMTFW
jgi:hypothetical protein